MGTLAVVGLGEAQPCSHTAEDKADLLGTDSPSVPGRLPTAEGTSLS